MNLFGAGGGIEISTLHFADEISFESVINLVGMLDTVPTDKVSLHFSSGGGCYAAMESLVHAVNNHEKDISVVLVGMAASAGFLFLCDCTRPIQVRKSAIGMIHYGDIELRARELKDKNSFSSFMLKDIENLNFEMLKNAIELGVSDDDLERIESGQDYWITYEKMKEWFHTEEEDDKKEKTPEEIRKETVKEITESVSKRMMEILGLNESPEVSYDGVLYQDDEIRIVELEKDEKK